MFKASIFILLFSLLFMPEPSLIGPPQRMHEPDGDCHRPDDNECRHACHHLACDCGKNCEKKCKVSNENNCSDKCMMQCFSEYAQCINGCPE